jgi:hypothetical protein
MEADILSLVFTLIFTFVFFPRGMGREIRVKITAKTKGNGIAPRPAKAEGLVPTLCFFPGT